MGDHCIWSLRLVPTSFSLALIDTSQLGGYFSYFFTTCGAWSRERVQRTGFKSGRKNEPPQGSYTTILQRAPSHPVGEVLQTGKANENKPFPITSRIFSTSLMGMFEITSSLVDLKSWILSTSLFWFSSLVEPVAVYSPIPHEELNICNGSNEISICLMLWKKNKLFQTI